MQRGDNLPKITELNMSVPGFGKALSFTTAPSNLDQWAENIGLNVSRSCPHQLVDEESINSCSGKATPGKWEESCAKFHLTHPWPEGQQSPHPCTTTLALKMVPGLLTCLSLKKLCIWLMVMMFLLLLF